MLLIDFSSFFTTLQEMVDVASFQTKALESRQVSREKEVLSLRQQLIDIQTQSDEKAIIGKYFESSYS